MALPRRLYDADVRANALMCDAVHAHGSLAGAELWYGGTGTSSLVSRAAPFSVESLPVRAFHPIQTRQGGRKSSLRLYQRS